MDFNFAVEFNELSAVKVVNTHYKEFLQSPGPRSVHIIIIHLFGIAVLKGSSR